MGWLLLSNGTDHPLIDECSAVDQPPPHIESIAHSLARIDRFTGHAQRPYSVAEHSLLVCDIVACQGLDADAQLLALMHDAHECLTGDVSSPVKRALGTPWRKFENLQAFAMRYHHQLCDAHALHSSAVRSADLIALATERRDLTTFDPRKNRPWPELDNPSTPVRPLELVDLRRKDPEQLCWRYQRDAFLRRFYDLATARIQPRAPTASAFVNTNTTADAT